MTDNRNLSSLSDTALQDPHIVWQTMIDAALNQ